MFNLMNSALANSLDQDYWSNMDNMMGGENMMGYMWGLGSGWGWTTMIFMWLFLILILFPLILLIVYLIKQINK